MAVVYRHIRLDKNEPFYIGIGKEEKRAYIKDGRNNLWNKIVKKTDYEVEILFDDLTYDEAKEKEIEFIKLYGRIDLGTGTLANLTDGGDGVLGWIPKEETLKKKSDSMKGRFDGDNNPFYGKNHKESTIELLKQYHKDKTLTEEHKDSIKKSMKEINKMIIKCPHCGKEGGTGGMKRFHFENCKNK